MDTGMVKGMLKKGQKKVWRFCLGASCYILPCPDRSTRARLLKNSALLAYVLVLIGFQLSVYRLSPRILGFATDIILADLYSTVNERRVEAGVGSLEIDSRLEAAAAAKAQDMFTKNYWAHYAPDGSTTPWQFIIGSGYVYKFAGENLAKDFDTSVSVVEAWIASPSHCSNLLNDSYQDIGMAVVNGTLLGKETTLVVQMFGTPQAVAAEPTPSTPSSPSGGVAGTTGSPDSEPAAEPEPTPEPEPEPASLEGPTEERVAVSYPTALVDVEVPLWTRIKGVVNPVSSPKTIPLGLGFVLIGLFTLDEAIMLRGGLTREEMRRTGENVAHVSVLGLLMVLVWFAKTGGVL
jgi:hypothetical protein